MIFNHHDCFYLRCRRFEDSVRDSATLYPTHKYFYLTILSLTGISLLFSDSLFNNLSVALAGTYERSTPVTGTRALLLRGPGPS